MLDELKRPSAVKQFTSREDEPETIDGLLSSENPGKWDQEYRQTWRVARPRSREDIMLDCRLDDGTRTAFAYFHLGQVAFDGTTIKLLFGEEEITVTGKNLERLYSALCQHRVPFIQEGNPREEALKPDGEPHIDSIRKEPHEVQEVRS